MAEKEFKHFIRIANTDLDGKKPIGHALTKIKGIGFQMATMVCSAAGLDRQEQTGMLDDAVVSKLEETLKNPLKFNIPSWALNRRRDFETGDDVHLLSGDLGFIQDNDKKLMQKIRSYKGVRHGKGLPVRGQRTKSNFRRNKGKGSLGVKRKK